MTKPETDEEKQIRELIEMPDCDIDFSDIPEVDLDKFISVETGRFYKPKPEND